MTAPRPDVMVDDLVPGDVLLVTASRPFLEPWWRPLDLGGLIEEDPDHFWDLDQLVHRIDVDPVEHANAVARLPRYDARAGSFSMSKIVAIPATLHALRIRGPLPPKDQARIVRRAMAFANARCADDVSEVRRCDAAFFGDLPLEVLLERMARYSGIGAADPCPSDDVELDLENTTVPWGLVTPRMVLSKHQGAHPPPLVRRRRRSVS